MARKRRGPRDVQSSSRLALQRRQRGVTQRELADATGISEPTIRRLESGEIEQPNLRYLVNCALALGCDLDDLIEEAWRDWYVFDARRSTPPDPDQFWTG